MNKGVQPTGLGYIYTIRCPIYRSARVNINKRV